MAVRQIRIALVEDSPTMRFFYKSAMEKFGFEVITAENGRQGWQIIYRHNPDVILLDMVLPDVSGLALLKKIREVDETKNIPVIALTSLKEMKQVQLVLQHGANHYSVKGNDSNEKLAKMIYKLLRKVNESNDVQQKVKISEELQNDVNNNVSLLEAEGIQFQGFSLNS